jgi:hypothetical protein
MSLRRMAPTAAPAPLPLVLSGSGGEDTTTTRSSEPGTCGMTWGQGGGG